MKRLLGFSALFLLVMWGLSFYVWEELHGGYEAPLHGAVERPPRLVLLGDSRAVKIAAAGLGEAALNLAHPSDGTEDMYAKLRFLLRHGVRPQVVIVQCDWHMFSRYRVFMNNRRRGLAMSTMEDAVEAYGASRHEFLLTRYLVRWIPLLDPGNSDLFRAKLAAQLFEESGAPLNWATVAGTGRWDAMPPDRARARVNWRYNQFYTEPWTPDYGHALKALVRECKEEGIRVVGVRYPEVPALRALVNATALTEVRRAYQELGIPILDLSRWFDDPTLFQDQDHLNPAGVERFTALLLRFLAAP